MLLLLLVLVSTGTGIGLDDFSEGLANALVRFRGDPADGDGAGERSGI